jgi:hypothetical protein
VTALGWVSNRADCYETLVFGTAYGHVVVWRQDNCHNTFVELASRCLPGGQEILSVTRDPVNKANEQRFAISSFDHSVYIYNVGQDTALTSLTVLSFDFVPRALTFISDSGTHDFYCFGENDGKRRLVRGTTGQVLKTVTMKQGVWVCLSPYRVTIYLTTWDRASVCAVMNERLLIDNGTDFTLHSLCSPESGPQQTYKVKATRYFPRQAAFAEKGQTVVCGSDHGMIYLFDASTGATCDAIHHSSGLLCTVAVSAECNTSFFDNAQLNNPQAYEHAGNSYILCASTEEGRDSSIGIYAYVPTEQYARSKATSSGTLRLSMLLLYCITFALAIGKIADMTNNVSFRSTPKTSLNVVFADSHHGRRQLST